MVDKILSRLKAKYSGVNLSKARLDAIAAKLATKITEETEIDAKLDELNDIMPFADIAKQDDKVRTLEAKSKDKADKKDDDSSDDSKKKDKSDDDMPTWFKTYQQEQNERIAKIERDKTTSSIQSRLEADLKDKVPSKYYKGRTLPEKDEDYEAFKAQIEADYTEFHQDLVNQGLMTAGKPAGGGGTEKATGKEEADIKEWTAAQKSATATT